ncbi:MAG: 2-succinyl-5-enolpyruvyl-6-hydroxy-3-cyclohexene-1-carboxylic-acid synthase [Bacteroidales bacterium]|nr:2-succinyl-5-enolpyruvyl-6-hydroxy-3-cyclohexene-1-carboxylic-acid synthase [Bacteroidales bacterium]
MTSDKLNAALAAEVFARKGMRHIVISPGSRNAPLIIAFAQHPVIQALIVIDERSAAFFALGIAQQTRKTVAIACTSGSAVLNYAPAIAEAYYQKIPLLVLTADRPSHLIDQGDGQTIRQKNVFANYIVKSYELPEEINSEEEKEAAVDLINEAINLTLTPAGGPVHINLPFSEPIYNQIPALNFPVKFSEPEIAKHEISENEINRLVQTWNSSAKKLVLVGMMEPDEKFRNLLGQLADDDAVVVLSETTSNLNECCIISCIDRVVSTIEPDEANDFKPDLLLTFGGHVVSKMVKAFLKNNKPSFHWNIDPVDFNMDTYQSLTDPVPMNPGGFLEKLLLKTEKKNNSYRDLWKERAERSEQKHQEFLAHCEYSDLKVFEYLLKTVPENSNLQLGNSTPVRYSQLFRAVRKYHYNSNRGTSGIDGTVSTAAGAAFVNGIPTTLITGDIGFLYDSNALMNHHLTGNLRIIIINNGGGGIFRFIPGPDTTSHLEKFFEGRHSWSAKYIAKNFDVPYYTASSLEELHIVLPQFYENQKDERPAILEIFTPNEKNAVILRNYFAFLKI